MSDHTHGEMDVVEHQQTFDGFIKFMTRGAIAVIVFLILLAIVNG